MSKPKARLTGEDGNIFNLLGIAGQALRKNEQREKEIEMTEIVFVSHSYENVLKIISEYVEII